MSKIHCKYDELVNPKDLLDHPKNRNKHKGDQIERLASMYSYHGIRHPIIVSKLSGYIVAGHGRKQAAIKAGIDSFPVVYQEFESDEHEYAFLQADNAIALWAELDIAGIQIDAMELSTEFNVDMLGVKDFELPNVTKENADPDEVPEPPKEPRSKLGDLYELGNHRLLCGDSTSIDAVDRLINGEKVDITFTSPPYNAGCFGYDDGKDKYKGKSDNKNQDEYFDFLISFTNIALQRSKFVFFNNQFLSGNRYALGKFFGYYHKNIKDVFPWIKNTAPPNVNKGVFTNRFEFFLCLEKDNSKKGFPVEWQGKYHNVIDGHTAAKDNITEGKHSATMPLYVPEWFLERLPFINNVYDPFGGSGTTLIACEKTNRKCFMMELDPHYIDVIVSRYVKFTGNNKIKLNGEEIEWSLDG